MAAAIAMLAVPVSAASPAIGGIGLAPSHSDPSNPETRAFFVHSLAPGQSFSDSVIVTNTGMSAVDLHVSAVDGLTGVTSGAVYANRQDPVRRWAAWVTPQVTELTVAPQSRTPVAFTVKAPSDATPGDHLAGLAFENAHPPTGGGTIAVTAVTRSVIAVLTQVQGPASFHLHLDQVNFAPLPADQQASVLITLGNDGGVLGKPELQVAVAGPNGYQRTVSRRLDTVLPGDTIAYPLPWPEPLAAGTYHVIVDGGAPGMASPADLSSTVTLASALVGPAPIADRVTTAAHEAGGTSWWLIPAVLGALVLGGGGGAVLTWRLARRA
jgi:hypothetical protein